MKSVCSPSFIANPSCLLVQLRGVSHLIVYLASMYVGVLQFHMLPGHPTLPQSIYTLSDSIAPAL